MAILGVVVWVAFGAVARIEEAVGEAEEEVGVAEEEDMASWILFIAGYPRVATLYLVRNNWVFPFSQECVSGCRRTCKVGGKGTIGSVVGGVRLRKSFHASRARFSFSP